ncbi:MAG: hypothetical protein AAF750_10935 [Planctomycetota bacterium]
MRRSDLALPVLMLVAAALLLIGPASTIADEGASGDGSGGGGVESTPNPAAGMQVSAPLRAHAEIWRQISAGRATAISSAAEGLRREQKDVVWTYGGNYNSLDGIGIYCERHHAELSELLGDLQLPDDTKLARELLAAYRDEGRRAEALRRSTSLYSSVRDDMLYQERVMGWEQKAIAGRLKKMDQWRREVESANSLDDHQGLGRAVRFTLRQKEGFDKVIPTVDKVLRSAQRVAPKARLLEFGAKEEQRNLKGFLKANDPAAWEKRIRALPAAVPSESSSGLANFAAYAEANRTYRAVLEAHVERLTGSYEDFEDGIGQDLLKLCGEAPAVVRQHRSHLNQLLKWKQQLEEEKEKARKWKERQESGVTGRG